jgi:hypothetical protein
VKRTRLQVPFPPLLSFASTIDSHDSLQTEVERPVEEIHRLGI